MPPRGSRLVEYVQVTCPCGTQFEVTRKRFEDGRGRRCSKKCQYTHMQRPSGLKYTLVKENPTKFKPGQQAWNKGVILKEEITYKELHRWVARHRVRSGVCDHCKNKARTQWANKSHEYRRDLEDWLELCRSCHGKHDSGDARGAAVRKYGATGVN